MVGARRANERRGKAGTEIQTGEKLPFGLFQLALAKCIFSEHEWNREELRFHGCEFAQEPV